MQANVKEALLNVIFPLTALVYDTETLAQLNYLPDAKRQVTDTVRNITAGFTFPLPKGKDVIKDEDLKYKLGELAGWVRARAETLGTAGVTANAYADFSDGFGHVTFNFPDLETAQKFIYENLKVRIPNEIQEKTKTK